MSSVTPLFNIFLAVIAGATMQEKELKGIVFKGRSKMAFIHGRHEHVHR